MFLVSQRDNNAITDVTNELKRVPILAGDFVLEMPPRGIYVGRVVVSSPVHRHTLIGVRFTKYAFNGLLKALRNGRQTNKCEKGLIIFF
jgi:hypothetical protein